MLSHVDAITRDGTVIVGDWTHCDVGRCRACRIWLKTPLPGS